MEYRDLYDKNRNITGDIVKKDDIIPEGKYYITVCVFIENSQKQVLLQINKKYNKWSLTGGHPITGEDSLEGIIREIKEELGISIKKDEIKLFKTLKTEDDFLDLYYLKKDINLKELIIQDEEVGEVKWFSISEINELIKNKSLLESHIPIFKEYINK